MPGFTGRGSHTVLTTHPHNDCVPLRRSGESRLVVAPCGVFRVKSGDFSAAQELPVNGADDIP